MRIEQVMSRYGDREYDKQAKKRLSSRVPFATHSMPRGCIDMLSLSAETAENHDNLTELVAFARMISDDRAKEWVKNVFHTAGSKEDGLINKLIIEIL
jgi:hypothetical protein